MTLSTLEVRWFLDGALADTGRDLEGWFRARPRPGGGRPPSLAWEPAPPAWRQDRYVLVPGQDDMGIKWREGALQIKGREAALGYVAFAPGIAGLCERWVKWSYAGEAIERRFRALFHGAAEPGIVVVEKRRLQRLLALDAAGEATEVGSGEPRPRGVNVELAQIRLAGAPAKGFWSLAFEAFPADASMAAPFSRIVARFAEGCPARPLAAERSMAYPRWLLELDPPG